MKKSSLIVLLVAVLFIAGCSQEPPQITKQPQSQTVDPGARATFKVSVSTAAAISWLKNSNVINGANSPTLNLGAVTAEDVGDYQAVAMNNFGVAYSDIATLKVSTPGFVLSEKVGGTDAPMVSLAIDHRRSRLAMAYSDIISEDSAKLMYAELSDAGWLVQEVADCASERFGRQLSLALDDSGQPIIAYYGDNYILNCARLCVQADCTGWKIEEAGSRQGQRSGNNCSLAYNPVTQEISIFFNSTGDYNLCCAKYNSQSGWSTSLLSWLDAGLESAAYDPLSQSVVCGFSTFGWTDVPSTLMYYCSDGKIPIEVTAEANDSDQEGRGLSLAISPSTGYPRISHGASPDDGWGLSYSAWDGQVWQTQEIKSDYSAQEAIAETSIAINGTDDSSRIAYVVDDNSFNSSAFNGALHLIDQSGEQWHDRILGACGPVHRSVSMVLTPQGKAIIAYGSNAGAYVIMEEGAWPFTPLAGEGE